MCLPFQWHLVHYNRLPLSEDIALGIWVGHKSIVPILTFFSAPNSTPQQVKKQLSIRLYFKDSVLILCFIIVRKLNRCSALKWYHIYANCLWVSPPTAPSMWESQHLNGQFLSLVVLQCDDHSFHSTFDFEWRIDWSTLKMLIFCTFGQWTIHIYSAISSLKTNWLAFQLYDTWFTELTTFSKNS